MNKSRETPPSAFPVRFGKYDVFTETGMTLRDWFAGQALMGALGGGAFDRMERRTDMVARKAYEFADAMLKEREL